VGTRVYGMREWLEVLDTLPERAHYQFPRVLGRAGMNIKKDWIARWKIASHPKGHIPHLIRSLSYDVDEEHATSWHLEVGVRRGVLQSRLATIISYGTLTSAPHDAGQHALDDEVPRFLEFVASVAQDLLTE